MSTEWILTISHLVHIMLANMTTICLYFCIVNYVSMEHSDNNVKFKHPKAPAKKYFWSDLEDVCQIPLNHMICRVQPPSSGSTAQYYLFDEADIAQVLGYLLDFFCSAVFQCYVFIGKNRLCEELTKILTCELMS